MKTLIELRLDLAPLLNEKCTNDGPCKGKTWQMTDAGNLLFNSLRRQGWWTQWTITNPDGTYLACKDGYYKTSAILVKGFINITFWQWLRYACFRNKLEAHDVEPMHKQIQPTTKE